MPNYSIAFKTPDGHFIHESVETENEEAALRSFFFKYIDQQYSKDEEGFSYFKEDFDDPESPAGTLKLID